MSTKRTYMESAAWQRAMDLAVELYLLAEQLPARDARFADQLTGAATGVPVAVTQALCAEGAAPTPLAAEAERTVRSVETLLLLAVRLKLLADAKVAPALSLADAVLDALRAPAVSNVAPAPAAAPVAATPRPAGQTGAAVAPAAAPPTPVTTAPAAPQAVSEPPPRREAPAVASTRAGSGPPKPQEGVDRLLVDGSNVLGRADGYSLGDPGSHDRLLLRLQEYGRLHPAHRIIAFFDGKRAGTRMVGGIEERVTSGQRTADDVIIDFLRGLPSVERRRCTLVTDDRELGNRARTQSVRVESVAWLSARLARPTASGERAGVVPGPNQSELSEWETFFNQPPKRPGR